MAISEQNEFVETRYVQRWRVARAYFVKIWGKKARRNRQDPYNIKRVRHALRRIWSGGNIGGLHSPKELFTAAPYPASSLLNEAFRSVVQDLLKTLTGLTRPS